MANETKTSKKITVTMDCEMDWSPKYSNYSAFVPKSGIGTDEEGNRYLIERYTGQSAKGNAFSTFRATKLPA